MNSQLKGQVQFLEELTNISSTTNDPKGVNLVQKILSKKLNSMGFKVRFIKNKQKHSGDALVAFYQGKKNESITLVGHADTVGRLSQNFHFKIDPLKDQITGPGIADNKGGLVVAISAIETFLKNNPRPEYSITFVSSPNEEEGSIGFHELFREIGKTTKYSLGMEPALQDGSIINSRNGNRWYRLNLKGIASHAGRFGEAHLNAAHEMALKIAKIHNLTDEQENIRVNIGSITGGNGSFNTICENIEALIDMRFPCFHKREKLSHQLIEIFMHHQLYCPKTNAQVKMSYKIEDDCPPLNYNPSHQILINQYLRFINNLEYDECQASHSGGASDINYFSTPNNFVLDGLGPIGGRLHTRQEYLVMSTLSTRAIALNQFLKHINIAEQIISHQQDQNQCLTKEYIA